MPKVCVNAWLHITVISNSHQSFTRKSTTIFSGMRDWEVLDIDVRGKSGCSTPFPGAYSPKKPVWSHEHGRWWTPVPTPKDLYCHSTWSKICKATFLKVNSDQFFIAVMTTINTAWDIFFPFKESQCRYLKFYGSLNVHLWHLQHKEQTYSWWRNAVAVSVLEETWEKTHTNNSMLKLVRFILKEGWATTCCWCKARGLYHICLEIQLPLV